jgi:MoxR-like ATPase
MGRESEQIDFLTAIGADNQGIFFLSGVPGVGKTSFLNIQQHLLESEEAQLFEVFFQYYDHSAKSLYTISF